MNADRDAPLNESAVRPVEGATLPPTADFGAPTVQPHADSKPTDTAGDGVTTEPRCAARTFGEYELLAEIARGGMGVVYKARQKRLNRTVAVKMILAGELADQEDVRRFLSEAEAAAGLDHPGIVPVYESGEIGGQHFFSMGFVEGQSLAALLSSGPLPPRRVADLIAEVADAVEYAHERGVIHRDLKPGNILLDQNGGPRVTDFGLAKRVAGDSGLTRTGQALGTPSYMPPEQASGKLDAIGRPADVYALGAVLYATLTGRPPFQAATPLDTILQLLEQEPVAPRQLNADVPRDLETIALKCLEKEPDKRYATARDLAEELRRFVRGEPIHARPISRAERAWRWCRRNQVLAGLAAAACTALVAGTATSTYFAIEANQRAGEAESSAQIAQKAQRAEAEQLTRTRAALAAETQAKEAESRARGEETVAKNEAHRAIDRFVDAVSEAELLKDARFQPLRKKLLSDALIYYRAFIESHKHDARQRQELADALRRVGYISAHTGSTDEAAAAFRRAIELSEKLVNEQPNVAAHLSDVAKACNDLGLLQMASGDYATARATYKRAVEIEEQLVAKFPATVQFRNELAKLSGNLGSLQMFVGEVSEARNSYQRSIDLAEKLVADNPATVEYRSVLAKSYDNLGILEFKSGNHDAARLHQQRALEILSELVKTSPAVAEYRNDLARAYENLGHRQRNDGESTAAIDSYEKAVDLLEKLVRDNPVVAEYGADLARNLRGLGVMYAASGNPSAAMVAYRRAAETGEKLAADNPNAGNYRVDLAMAHHELGLLQDRTGDQAAARSTFQRVVELREKLVADNPTDVEKRIDLGGACCNLAGLIRRQAEPARALEAYVRADKALQAALDKEPNNETARLFLRNTCWGRAQTLMELGNFSEAAEIWRRTIELNFVPEIAIEFRIELAESLVRAGDYAGAANEVAGLATSEVVSGETLYHLASVFSLCAAAAKDDAAIADAYAERAMGVLKRSQAAGYFGQADRIAHFHQDKDFDALRDRDDFRQFVDQLSTVEAGNPPQRP